MPKKNRQRKKEKAKKTCTDEDVQDKLTEFVTKFSDEITSPDLALQFSALDLLNATLCTPGVQRTYVGMIIESEVMLTTLIDRLNSTCFKVQMSALSALGAITTMMPTPLIVKVKGTLPLLNFVKQSSTNKELQIGFWVLANVIRDMDGNDKTNFYKMGGIPPIVELVRMKKPLPIVKMLASSIHHLCNAKHDESPFHLKIVKLLLPAAISLLDNSNKDIREKTLITIAHACAEGEEITKEIVASGVIPKMVEVLKTPSLLVEPALTAIAAILSNPNAAHRQAVLDGGFLHQLIEVTNYSSDTATWRAAFWGLSFVTSGMSKHRQMIRDGGLFPVIIKALANEDSRIRLYAVLILWDFLLAPEADEKLVEALIKDKVIEPLFKILKGTDLVVFEGALKVAYRLVNLCPKECWEMAADGIRSIGGWIPFLELRLQVLAGNLVDN